jgi:hypothetical protein
MNAQRQPATVTQSIQIMIQNRQTAENADAFVIAFNQVPLALLDKAVRLVRVAAEA